ncbi:thioesterase II family protein [Streptomyces sp. NPDC057565]|uniref:thioesterase II family protein n=1 Tax=Streptomyces sp. NPDC057565 TaxID=3346169 RepID=UPI003682A5BB
MNAGVWASTGPGFEEAPIRLLCFAHAGGGPLFYRPWRDPLLPEIGVLAAVLPGRETRVRERPCERLDELLPPLFDALRPYADRPFALFGHSLGAIVAYEMARLFSESGTGPPLRLFVSGRRAPHLPARHAPRHTLTDVDFLGLLTQLGGTPPEILRQPGMAELFLPSLRADFRMNETYDPAPERPPLFCPVTALTGDADPEVTRDDIAAWSAVTCRDFRMRTFDGDHFYLKSAPPPVVSAIRTDLGLLDPAPVGGAP